MKNKLDRFDDDWKWDVLPTRMLYELLLSPTYRWPWKVKIVCSYRWGAEFPKCPRCGTTMEREYQLFCNHCGQRLNWSGFDDVEVRYIAETIIGGLSKCPSNIVKIIPSTYITLPNFTICFIENFLSSKSMQKSIHTDTIMPMNRNYRLRE